MFQATHQANWNNNFPNKTSTVVAKISILLLCFVLVSNAKSGGGVTEDIKSNTRSSCSTRYSLHTSLISQIGVSGKQCYHPLPTGNNRPEGWRTKTMAAMNSGHRFCLICTIHCWYMQLLVVSPQLPCRLGAVAPDGPASATLDSCTFVQLTDDCPLCQPFLNFKSVLDKWHLQQLVLAVRGIDTSMVEGKDVKFICLVKNVLPVSSNKWCCFCDRYGFLQDCNMSTLTDIDIF